MKIINNFFNEETLQLIQECYLNNFDKGDWIHGYSFYEKKGVKQNLEIMVLKTATLNDSVIKYLLDAIALEITRILILTKKKTACL